MVEDDGGPGRAGFHGIEKRNKALFSVENSQFHGEIFGETDADSEGSVFLDPLAVSLVHGGDFLEDAAGDAALGGLLDELLVERIYGIGRAGELDVAGGDGLEHGAVVGGDLNRVADDAEVVERASGSLPFGVGALEFRGEGEAEAALFG